MVALIVTLSGPKILDAQYKVPPEPPTVPELIQKYATEYNVSASKMTKTIQCESSFNPNAVGDGGNSYGLSQIHLPSWGGSITKEQALNPDFAVKFMAQQFSQGNARKWTCYRIYYA